MSSERPKATFVAVMDGVTEQNEGRPAELWLRDGKAIIRAYNEAGFNSTEIFLESLIEWLSEGSQNYDAIRKCIE